MDGSASRAVTALRSLLSVLGGMALVVIGLAGLVLPLLPGWLLIVAGVTVLAGAVPPVRRLVSKLVTTTPAQAALSGAARHDRLRSVISRALQQPVVRRGLTSSCRRQLVRKLLRHGVTRTERSA